MYRVAFTGYRPSKLPFFGEDDPLCAALKVRINAEIQKLAEDGAVEFYSGMALGVDIWSAELVLELKKTYPEIQLIAMLPCRNQDAKWNLRDKERYHSVLDQCDKVMCLNESYTDGCMLQRNRALVDISDVLIAVFDGKSGGTKYTVDYAHSRGRDIRFISPV